MKAKILTVAIDESIPFGILRYSVAYPMTTLRKGSTRTEISKCSIPQFLCETQVSSVFNILAQHVERLNSVTRRLSISGHMEQHSACRSIFFRNSKILKRLSDRASKVSQMTKVLCQRWKLASENSKNFIYYIML